MCAGTHLKTNIGVGCIKVLQLFNPFVAASILGKADYLCSFSAMGLSYLSLHVKYTRVPPR